MTSRRGASTDQAGGLTVEEIKEVQQLLQLLGFLDAHSVTGKFDKNTVSALCRWGDGYNVKAARRASEGHRDDLRRVAAIAALHLAIGSVGDAKGSAILDWIISEYRDFKAPGRGILPTVPEVRDRITKELPAKFREEKSHAERGSTQSPLLYWLRGGLDAVTLSILSEAGLFDWLATREIGVEDNYPDLLTLLYERRSSETVALIEQAGKRICSEAERILNSDSRFPVGARKRVLKDTPARALVKLCALLVGHSGSQHVRAGTRTPFGRFVRAMARLTGEDMPDPTIIRSIVKDFHRVDAEGAPHPPPANRPEIRYGDRWLTDRYNRLLERTPGSAAWWGWREIDQYLQREVAKERRTRGEKKTPAR